MVVPWFVSVVVLKLLSGYVMFINSASNSSSLSDFKSFCAALFRASFGVDLPP